MGRHELHSSGFEETETRKAPMIDPVTVFALSARAVSIRLTKLATVSNNSTGLNVERSSTDVF